jgi:hypothetical protein
VLVWLQPSICSLAAPDRFSHKQSQPQSSSPELSQKGTKGNMKAIGTMRRHWFYPFLVFLLGTVLPYAPFALLTRLILWVSGSPLLPDAHRICMRMPIQWLTQP